MKIISVAGISGSGKTTVLQVLGDEGYLILDSLTCATIDPVVRILNEDPNTTKIAVVLDFKTKEELDCKCKSLKEVTDELKIELMTFFVTAETNIIINRFKEARRLHPFMAKQTVSSIEQSIKLEQDITYSYAYHSDFIFDTTDTSVIENRKIVLNALDKKIDFSVNIISFGFKYDSVAEADYIFDLRFLPNPFYIPALRNQTGLDDDVYNYVFAQQDANEFFEAILKLLKIALRNSAKEGRIVTTIAFGCTGGQHRSVSFARRLASTLSSEYKINVMHRELAKD